MTPPDETTEPAAQPFAPAEPLGNVIFKMGWGSGVSGNVRLYGDPDDDDKRLDYVADRIAGLLQRRPQLAKLLAGPEDTPSGTAPAVAPAAGGGVPAKGFVPGEFCGTCGGPARYTAQFQSKQNKRVGAKLECATCKNEKGYDLLIRWLNDDDSAWNVIRAAAVPAQAAQPAQAAPPPQNDPPPRNDDDLPF